MDYTPHTAHDIQSMLKEIGLSSIEGLFEHLPKELLDPDIDLNKGLSEFEVMSAVQKLARKNTSVTDCPGFLGGGLYDHYIPPAVDAIANRSEFYTAYTPYQPEASQGALQAMIEYQTAIAKLTQMDIANASLYDGSSALAEAVLMAVEITGKSEILVSETIHPEWLEVLDTYLSGRDIYVKTIPNLGGESDFKQIKSLISDDTACLCIANPNFFGVIEDYRDIKKELEAHKALLLVATYPFSLGFLEPPGAWGADIVIGDGQSLGNYMGFGGPHYGFLACKMKYVRKIPGRIVGETVDRNNKKGYCLTFQTREQHIRREKATSNICSNQALIALRTAIYLSILGEEGLREASTLAYHKAHYFQKGICKLSGFELHYDKPFYNEFVIKSPVSSDSINEALMNEGIIGGLSLDRFGFEGQNLMLLAVTEKRTKDEMDRFVKVLQKLA